MMTTPTVSFNPTTLLNDTILTDIADKLLTGQRLTVKDLAETHGVKVQIMREHLMAAFNEQIEFKRGRTGGIVLKNA
jgi:DNA-binding IscR family transcriptional regulator